MSVVQRQTATAFPRTPAASGRRAGSLSRAALPRRDAPAPASAPLRKAAPAPPRARIQTAWFAFMLTAGLVATLTGLFYLSGHAAVTREGYRRVALLRQLRAERERGLSLAEVNAVAAAPAKIEQKALWLNMVRADQGRTVTVGTKE